MLADIQIINKASVDKLASAEEELKKIKVEVDVMRA